MLDETLLHLLADRIKLSEKIGELKREKDVTIFQKDRWNFILERALKIGKDLNLSEGFVKNVLIQVHDESIRTQNEIFKTELERKD